MSQVLLLDADIIAYKLAATSQRNYRFPGMDEPAVACDDFDTLPERIDREVSELTRKLKAAQVIVCLSCPTADNWRLKVLPTYKGNRAGTIRPVYLQAVKDYLEETYPSYRRDGLEADDIMGILSTMQGLPGNFLKEHPEFNPKARKVIVSEDKDMKTIPGWLFNPAKDKAPWLVSQEEADRWHLYQAIVGDTTDGYVGCEGAGPDRALPVLDGLLWSSYEHTLKSGPRKGLAETRWKSEQRPEVPVWDRVAALYQKHGLTEEDALVQARVARICRASDYDFKKKEVILWTPSK